jgi:predicted DNA-binding WGR domain protein
MTAVTLTRTDHARRMARFCVLDVQPDLFGAWCFIREWGRIGRPGQWRQVPYPTEDKAKEALARQRHAKEGSSQNLFQNVLCSGPARAWR